jgi:hypothetical protein
MSGSVPRSPDAAKRVPADARTISIFCAKCNTLLYKYRKGGTGSLVKVRPERIAEDHTAGDLRCPSCKQAFARERDIGGGPAYKIIGGKVFTKGMRRK